MSDVSLEARPRDSLAADENVKIFKITCKTMTKKRNVCCLLFDVSLSTPPPPFFSPPPVDYTKHPPEGRRTQYALPLLSCLCSSPLSNFSKCCSRPRSTVYIYLTRCVVLCQIRHAYLIHWRGLSTGLAKLPKLNTHVKQIVRVSSIGVL